MGSALQVLNFPTISVAGTTDVIDPSDDFMIYLPIPCYPTKLVSVQVSSFLATYPFDVTIYANTSPYYQAPGNVADLFDNPVVPIPVGGFFLTLDGVSEFGTINLPDSLTNFSLTILPVLPDPSIPYLTMVIVNNSADPEAYDVVVGFQLLGKGYDEAPILYPGLGSSIAISSSNI